ncbi:MAG: hypothetical protein WBX49_01270 [Candidatus Deferrimicrobiaceae bacterium]
MVKRVNANLPDEVHRALRVKLAEDGTKFSDWLRARIEEYLGKGGKIVKSPIVMPPIPRSELLPRLERRRKKRTG